MDSDYSIKGCLVKIVRCKNMFSQMNNWHGIQELIKYSYCDVKFNVIIKVGKYSIVGEIQFTLNVMIQAKKIGHTFYSFSRQYDLYLQLAKMIENFENIDDISGQIKNLDLIVAQKDYPQLVNLVLFGRLNDLIKRRAIDFDKYVKLCDDNDWKKGKKLLKDAITRINNQNNLSDDSETKTNYSNKTQNNANTMETSEEKHTSTGTNKKRKNNKSRSSISRLSGARSSVSLSGMKRAHVALKLYNLMVSNQMDKFEIIIEGVAARQATSNPTPNQNEIETNKENKENINKEKSQERKDEINNKSDLDFIMNDWVHNESQRTLLTGACSIGSDSAVDILINYGVNVNKRDELGATALNQAVFNGFRDIVQVLLESDADPNLDGTSNCTNMWFAGYRGDVDIMKLLIKHGFNFKNLANQCDDDGFNTFDMMCQFGYLRCIEYFVSIGKKTNTKLNIYNNKNNAHGMNPLQVALNFQLNNVARYLINELNYLNGKENIINEKSKNGKTAIWFAALKQNIEMVKLLGSHSECDLNVCDNMSHDSVLFIAAAESSLECVEWLMNQEKCDVNLPDKYQQTPLLYCCRYGNNKSVELLCQCDRVDLNKTDEYNNTPIVLACYFGYAECVRHVLNALIKRSQVSNWDELEKANILNGEKIDRYIDICQQNKESRNDKLRNWLFYIKNKCVNTKNFELLMIRLGDKGNEHEKEIQEKFEHCQKIHAITCGLLDLCNKNVAVEVSKAIISMIKNKEIVNDELLMIAVQVMPKEFENALIKSVRDTVQVKDIDKTNSSNARDIAWFKNCILTSTVLCLNSSTTSVATAGVELEDVDNKDNADTKEKEEEIIFDRINQNLTLNSGVLIEFSRNEL